MSANWKLLGLGMFCLVKIFGEICNLDLQKIRLNVKSYLK